jgi:hypothetical protein
MVVKFQNLSWCTRSDTGCRVTNSATKVCKTRFVVVSNFRQFFQEPCCIYQKYYFINIYISVILAEINSISIHIRKS